MIELDRGILAATKAHQELEEWAVAVKASLSCAELHAEVSYSSSSDLLAFDFNTRLVGFTARIIAPWSF